MLTTDYQEAAMMKFASEQLKLVRTYSPFGGDPFTGATMHAMVRRTLKGLAEVHERNMARIVTWRSPARRTRPRRSRS